MIFKEELNSVDRQGNVSPVSNVSSTVSSSAPTVIYKPAGAAGHSPVLQTQTKTVTFESPQQSAVDPNDAEFVSCHSKSDGTRTVETITVINK